VLNTTRILEKRKGNDVEYTDDTIKVLEQKLIKEAEFVSINNRFEYK
jgi:hypothetical protein